MNNYKKFDTKSLRKSVTFYISAAMLLLIIFTAVATSVIQNSRQAQREKEYSSQIHRSIDHTINHFIQDYSSRVDRMINTTGMPELLAKREIWENSWIVKVEDIKDYDLSAKNPNKQTEEIIRKPNEILKDLEENDEKIKELFVELKNIL